MSSSLSLFFTRASLFLFVWTSRRSFKAMHGYKASLEHDLLSVNSSKNILQVR